MEKFIYNERYGNLYMDRVILESQDIPIIFTLINDNKEVFFGICYTTDKYLIGKTTPENIIKMLSDKITMRVLFTEYSSDVFLIGGDEDINDECLPIVDSFIEAEDGEFNEEMEYFMSLGAGE